MSSVSPLAPAGFPVRRLAAVSARPVLALALLLPASALAAVPRALAHSGSTVAAPAGTSKVADPSCIELAGNKKRDRDDNFDPYGKDDPTNKKWGASAGFGNRYGGLNTGGDVKKKDQKGERNSDRADREPRPPREE
jgi:hypothetical protein